MEDEAELGSDDEDKDDVRKEIDMNDEEENEEGLDEDLRDFVDTENKQPSQAEEAELYAKYQEEMEREDREGIARTMQAVIFGRNQKKRKRDDLDWDSQDESSKRKMRMI